MIERLTLRNFQAHEKLTIEFSPEVTTIIGRTDRGKSSIIRALKWLVTNKPGGTAFIRHGAPEAKVILRVDNRTVKRVRGMENKYVIDKKTLKAFKHEPPEEITNLLSLGPQNFQAQHDAPFWFAQSPGEVSRQLNQIINLGAIDKTLANLNAKLREAGARVTVAEERLAEAKAVCKTHARTPLMVEKWGVVAGLNAKAEETAVKAEKLRLGLAEALAYHQRAKNAGNAALRAKGIAELGVVWWEQETKCEKLAELVKNGQRAKKLAGADIPDVVGLLDSYSGWQTKQKRWLLLENLVTAAQGWQEEINSCDNGIVAAEAEFKTKVGKVCLLCGQTLKK